jgi:nitrate reductase gamma subunit
MSTAVANIFIWMVMPYVSMIIFIVGHIWRYRRDQFGWTSRSTQLLEGHWLGWGSVLFHYGALAAIAGHILGILVPEQATNAIGISEHAYHVLAADAGTIAGTICFIGLIILIGRRAFIRRVRATTSAVDLFVFIVLAVIIGLGLGETMAVNLLGHGYDYRPTVGVWFRSLFLFNPNTSIMSSAPIIYQLHAASPWLLYALWPFSRLVHAWSYPIQYLSRPYILYRRRYLVSQLPAMKKQR